MIIVFVLFAVVIISLAAIIFIDVHRKNTYADKQKYAKNIMHDSDSAVKELIGIFDTREEAQFAADQYKIELKSYSNRVATFIVEEPLSEVMQRGEKLGLAPLYINHEYTMHAD